LIAPVLRRYCADVAAERIHIEIERFPRAGALVPVTARLSRKFYERFGDEIAGELVDWFNAVDSTYQQQLRDLNDLNWERFKAELHAAIAQSETRLTQSFSGKHSEMMKWMFIYWSGTVVTLGGLMVAMLTIMLRR
jgi:hypothetical protein